ncbi:OB-fold domain-containing protein [Streptosporangium sp. NPDC051022]|uniref:Zn-ribbon domain-containing OB-fold protein n=1 Tax=Streptosporangium sp. NPDC051022 TaxID=3155752 RepID=UPI00341674BC
MTNPAQSTVESVESTAESTAESAVEPAVEPTVVHRVVTVTDEWLKPLPSVDHDNAPFWEGLREHRLLLWTCGECGASYFPKAYCRDDHNLPFAEQMEWKESSGLGTIHTANIHRRAFDEEFAADVPYAFGLVRLDEGPLISSTIDDVDDPVAAIGRRVEVYFEDHPAEGFTLPRFRLIDPQA